MGMEIPVGDISVMTPQVEEEKPQTLIPEKETTITAPATEQIPEKESSKIESGEKNDANLSRKNAAVEWKQSTYRDLYFPKIRPIEDPKIKAKIDQLRKTMDINKELKGKIFGELSVKNKERSEIMGALVPLREKLKELNGTINQKKTEMAPVKEGLAKIRTDNFAIKEKGHGLCSSVEELNDLLKSLEYRMNHETMKLDEEKKLMKEIKQLEGTRARVIATAAERSKLDLNPKKGALEDQKKVLVADMDEIKSERDAIWAKIKPLEDQKAPIEAAIKALEDQKKALTEKNDKSYKSLMEAFAEKDALNQSLNENRNVLNRANVLAAQKNVAALEALCESEVEKFMTSWNTNKAFQEDYKKRGLRSLDMRQLSIDGRVRNPDEKPILQVQPATPKTAELDPTPDPAPAPLAKPAPAKKEKAAVKPAVVVAKEEEEEEEYFVSEKKLGGESVKKEVVDMKKLKEMKRQEEIAKNKMALERKKKLAEKNAAKAAAKAQKEAEEKLKKKEAKKAKKKSPSDSEPTETEPNSDPTEPAETEPNAEPDWAPIPQPKARSVSVKSRNKKKGQNSAAPLPKVILKRKKSGAVSYAHVALAALLAVLVGGGAAYYYKFYAMA